MDEYLSHGPEDRKILHDERMKAKKKECITLELKVDKLREQKSNIHQKFSSTNSDSQKENESRLANMDSKVREWEALQKRYNNLISLAQPEFRNLTYKLQLKGTRYEDFQKKIIPSPKEKFLSLTFVQFVMKDCFKFDTSINEHVYEIIFFRRENDVPIKEYKKKMDNLLPPWAHFPENELETQQHVLSNLLKDLTIRENLKKKLESIKSSVIDDLTLIDLLTTVFKDDTLVVRGIILDLFATSNDCQKLDMEKLKKDILKMEPVRVDEGEKGKGVRVNSGRPRLEARGYDEVISVESSGEEGEGEGVGKGEKLDRELGDIDKDMEEIAKAEEERERGEREKREAVEGVRVERERVERERKDKEERERKEREEAERERVEQERKDKEEAERVAREERERKDKEEAERVAREEADRLAREEQERKDKEERERKDREEQKRKDKEAAETVLREERERKHREEADKLAREEQERKDREEAERVAREEADRLAVEEQERKDHEE